MSQNLAVAPDAAPEFQISFGPSQLAAKQEELAQASQLARSLQIVDAASLAEANEWCKILLSERDALEAMRTSVTKPMLDAKRRVDEWFKPLTQAIDQAVGHLKPLIGMFLQAERQRQAVEYQRALEAHAQGQHTQAVAALNVAGSAAVAPPDGTSMREVWRAQVVNPGMLTREWLIPDEAKIEAHAKATPANAEPYPVPGVRFYKEASVTVRR
jgi:hypothetical protein